MSGIGSNLVSKRNSRAGDYISLILLVIVTFLLIMPVYYMVITSLKSIKEVMAFPPTLFPKEIMWSNYLTIFKKINYLTYFKNSLIIALLTTFGTVLSSSLVAFGFSRYRARGKNLIFMVVISTLLLPYPALIIPQYLIFQGLGWINTFLPIIVPAFFGNAYYIFLLRQFFTTVPDELFEAAKIDGCSEFRSYWNISLPICKPALATVAIFQFLWSWNDLIDAVIYLNSDIKFTLPIGMAGLLSSFRLIPWQLIMTGNIIALVPIIILFVFAQKYFVEGITISGLK